MRQGETIVHKVAGQYGTYQVVDMTYNGRPARVLFSDDGVAAMSGIALDGEPELLFDYNQRLMELITAGNPKNLLLIGGGVFTLPMAVLHALPRTRVDAVERDAAVLKEVAERFFGLRPSDQLRIIQADGFSFLAANRRTYDCIIVDAFDNYTIPASITSPDAIRYMRRSLRKRGFVAMNVITPGKSAQLESYRAAFADGFAQVSIIPAEEQLPPEKSQNFIIVSGNEAVAAKG